MSILTFGGFALFGGDGVLGSVFGDGGLAAAVDEAKEAAMVKQQFLVAQVR